MRNFFMVVLMFALAGVGSVAQAAYDIKTMTPQVKAALEARKERFSALKELKARGSVGESNRGYVEALGDVSAQNLVDAENADRRVIYEAIVEQNGLGDGAMATVETVFAGVQRDKAQGGEKVQNAAGEWIVK